jgi:hypothetical protein
MKYFKVKETGVGHYIIMLLLQDSKYILKEYGDTMIWHLLMV